jgi:hypothetical protein
MRIEQLTRDYVTKERSMANQDQDVPNRTSTMEKAEEDRKSEWGEGTSEGAGQSVRPMGEAIGNPESVPASGDPTPGRIEG